MIARMEAVRAAVNAALEAALGDVAALRIAVFRDWPYLYDGDADYEARYLDTYAQGVIDELKKTP